MHPVDVHSSRRHPLGFWLLREQKEKRRERRVGPVVVQRLRVGRRPSGGADGAAAGGKLGQAQVAASPQAPHRLPAFSHLSSPNTAFGGCSSREILIKRERKPKKADTLAETTARHPSGIAG